MPKEHQEEFWKQVAFKENEFKIGEHIYITTYKDARTKVRITSSDGNVDETFWHPRDMTDKQLDEFKRAQNNKRSVGVEWQKDGDKKPINAVTVYSYLKVV